MTDRQFSDTNQYFLPITTQRRFNRASAPAKHLPILNSTAKHSAYQWKSRYTKSSIVLTAGILGIIFSATGLVMLAITAHATYRPTVLLQCDVENFRSPPYSRSEGHDYSTKCRFLNLDISWNYKELGPCGFDQFHDFVYANVPKGYQARTPVSKCSPGTNKVCLDTEIFWLPCNYSIHKYCPIADAPSTATRTSRLKVYPARVRSLVELMNGGLYQYRWQCMENTGQVVGHGLTLITVFVISLVMVMYDILPMINYNGDTSNGNSRSGIIRKK